jgi:hypothetical protein
MPSTQPNSSRQGLLQALRLLPAAARPDGANGADADHPGGGRGPESSRQLEGQPTFDEVRECFKEARQFYKGGLKSWNKVYDRNAASDKEKVDRRYEQADESSELSFRQSFQHDFLRKPFEEIGRDIFSHHATIAVADRSATQSR